jgi:hypothetical protein
MCHAVCIGHDYGACFWGRGSVCCDGVSIQIDSKEVWQRKNQIDVVLVFADVFETCETGRSSILRKILDQVNEVQFCNQKNDEL